MKPRVLHVTQSTIGGTLEYLKLLLPRLRGGFELSVACPAEGPMQQEIESLGFPVQIVPMIRAISPFADARGLAALWSLMRRDGPDLVHLHSSKAGVVGRLAAGLLGVPAIYTAHGWSFAMRVSPLKQRLYAWIERHCARWCDRIVNISASEQELARRHCVAPDDKMQIIHNGIAPARFRLAIDRTEARSALGIPADAQVVGMVARLTAAKQPLTFVRAAAQIAAALPRARFVLVGDGELRSAVTAAAAAFGIADRFRITGWTDAVPQWLATFDVAVLTSAWEGFGLVVAEYMAARRPLVASRLDAIAEIVRDGVDGMLVEPDDDSAFSDAVVALLVDRARAARLVEHAELRVRERFDIDRVAAAHRMLYHTVLRERGRNCLAAAVPSRSAAVTQPVSAGRKP